MLTKTDEKKIQDIVETTVVQAIQKVVIPAMDNLEDELSKKIDRLDNRVEQIDRKLDIMTAKVYTHDSQLTNHDKRIKKLEHIATP